MIRFWYAGVLASLTALATAAVARPALLWVSSQGLFHTALAREVPCGPQFLGAATLLAFLALWLACRIALGRKAAVALRVSFLMAVGICLALRQAADDPRPPPDPGPALLAALRTAAEELDRRYAGEYDLAAAALATALSQGPPLPFRRLGRSASLRARVLPRAPGPRLEGLAGDPPGTLYLAISEDRQTAWLTALSLEDVLRLPSGAPAVIEARRGTHALPGTDPAVPVYPRARAGR